MSQRTEWTVNNKVGSSTCPRTHTQYTEPFSVTLRNLERSPDIDSGEEVVALQDRTCTVLRKSYGDWVAIGRGVSQSSPPTIFPPPGAAARREPAKEIPCPASPCPVVEREHAEERTAMKHKAEQFELLTPEFRANSWNERERYQAWLASARWGVVGEQHGLLTVQPSTTLEFDLDYVQTLAQ